MSSSWFRERHARRLGMWAALVAILSACSRETPQEHAPGVSSVPAESTVVAARVAFFDVPRRGTNYFARPMDDAWLAAAAAAGIGWVRLAPDIWPTARRDFLLGDADAYGGLDTDDLALLRSQLDLAEARAMPIVLTMLSLPGARWRQHNDGVDDHRLWEDPARFRPQAVAFWSDLVAAIGDHPALVAVNVLNEPRPADAAAVNPFYREVVAAIRARQPDLPILLDAAFDAAPAGFDALEASADPLVLYDVHLYEPWDFVTWRVNQGRYGYPGPDGAGQVVDRAYLDRILEPVRRWQQRYEVASNRVVMGEFGIDRRIAGAAAYLADAIDLAESEGWHWAFYAFRDWQALDYELGPGPLPEGYWAAEERGEPMVLPRVPNPLWDVLAGALRR